MKNVSVRKSAILESFSIPHDIAYSIEAVQEANLAVYYNPLYWACACLSVDAGSSNTAFDSYDEDAEGDEENPEDVLESYEMVEDENGIKKPAVVTNYGKVARAISNIQGQGYKVFLPDINEAQSDFRVDTKRDGILYGMSAIISMNADIISDIISHRPYTSLSDFLSKVTLTTVQMISLIKAGAFDELEGKSRFYIMDQYLRYNAEQKIAKKEKLTMANYDKALELDIIPDQFTMQVKMTFFKISFRHSRKFLDKGKRL